MVDSPETPEALRRRSFRRTDPPTIDVDLRDAVLRWASDFTPNRRNPDAVLATAEPILEWLQEADIQGDLDARTYALRHQYRNLDLFRPRWAGRLDLRECKRSRWPSLRQLMTASAPSPFDEEAHASGGAPTPDVSTFLADAQKLYGFLNPAAQQPATGQDPVTDSLEPSRPAGHVVAVGPDQKE